MSKDLNSTQAGFYQESDVNNPTTRTFKGKNLFPQSFVHPSTCLYGFVDPVAFVKCEVGDVFPYKFVTDLNTFTLSSPLKSKVKMHSAAYKVPMEAIYPRNWNIMLPIPNKGDDVPDDTRAVLNIANFVGYLNSYLESIREGSNNISRFVRIIFLYESLFSTGGIFSKANLHLCHHRLVYDDSDYFEFDDWFDTIFVPTLKEYFASLPMYGSESVHLVHYSNLESSSGSYFDYTVTDDPSFVGRKSSPSSYYITIERAIELLRSGDYELVNREDILPSSYFQTFRFDVTSLPRRINIEPIIAYQLACSHFFNNPKVDFVYSAPLYRDNLESIYLSVLPLDTFEWNGISKYYDVFSEHTFNKLLTEHSVNCLYFWSNLFNFHNSLRYGDYFTGAHPEPIAPGDINAPVIDGSVNAIDTTKSIQLARLLNKVNISGPRISDYIRSILGGPLPEVPKDVPVRLSKETFDVGGFEVNNTGSAQLDESSENITTTNLRLDDSRFMFEAHIDSPCWIVVVQYFEAHRIYSKTMDRFAFHFDRFDDFIPDLQYIGDQDVKSREIDSIRDSSVPFAYNLRYMEYKQRYSYASGGFINKLKSWAFITDNFDGNPATGTINPEYIRSSPSEFDRFYKQLSGYSLGTRFHFITFNTNVCAPYRQMVYAPEILA